MNYSESSIIDLSLLIQLLVSLVGQLQEADPRFFLLTIVGAIFLSGAMWWICSVFSNLWNKRYHLNLWHHLLCFLAAVITFFSTLVFFSIPYLKPLVEYSVKTWQVELERNTPLWNKALDECRKILLKKGIPQTTPNVVTVTYTTTGPGGTETKNGIKDVSRIFANTILKDFWDKRPMLSLILWARGAEARKAMGDSMVAYFDSHPGQFMNPGIVIQVGASKIREDLDRQIPKIVPYARGALIVFFILAQVIPFGMVGYSSYRDIKVVT